MGANGSDEVCSQGAAVRHWGFKGTLLSQDIFTMSFPSVSAALPEES